MRMNLDHVASGHLVLGEMFFASLIIAKWDGRILHYYILTAHIYRGEIVEGSV